MPRNTSSNKARIDSLIDMLTAAVVKEVKARARERLGVKRLRNVAGRQQKRPVAETTCKRFANGQTLRQTVINMFYANAGRDFSTAQVARVLSARGNTDNSVSVTTAKLVVTGELVRVRRGVYRANIV